MAKISLFWHRRDLRSYDNAGLYHALNSGRPVLPIFIFDREILDKLEERDDARVEFIHRSVTELADVYRAHGGDLRVYYGHPTEIWPKLLKEFPAADVYTNRDYEKYALERDEAVKKMAEAGDGKFHDYKDHVIFEGEEVPKNAGGPYTVFTPFKRKWLEVLDSRMDEYEGEEISYYLKPYPCEKYLDNLLPIKKPGTIPSLKEMDFEPSDIEIPDTKVAEETIENYDKNRDYPARRGTSRLGIHFRHGTVSIRKWAKRARELNEVFLSELIWRDFYSNILQHFPYVEDRSFRPEYDGIPWINDEEAFQRWCDGRTGVPLVDAAMRELNTIGYMHNRMRMLTASYLTKHLLTDWRWGEAYFGKKLLDYELASNNGGWQWAAGCGTDAQPYFRIFNADSQQKKFDAKYEYVKNWVPEYGTDEYPQPIVEHKEGRERALRVYKESLAEARGN
ncbi:MAG: deoxyribodipyrimidine photo-lyase [Saprospiraceae bacterium]